MAVLDFWGDLTPARKAGLSVGAVLVATAVGVGAWWALSTGYAPVMRAASPEKVAVAVREIERLKVPYRVSDDGLTVEVPEDKLGQVKVNLAGHGLGGDAAGFELFNNTDFSTTEFTQKINFQRALQGELARTISSIEGVSSARVHIVLPESGFLRRKSVPPTAAVNVAMNPGSQLTAGQVHGIQKLVAASVPEIKLDDITVIDQDGIALTQNKSGESDPAKRGQLELKREVDSYLEGKLKRMLSALDPQGEFSVSVDATLNASDARVTTEDLLPVEGAGGKVAGVVVRERQSQRHDNAPVADAAGSSPSSGSVVREVEYKVGHRVEQIVTAPGGIERLSVAVLARSGNLPTDSVTLRGLVANAIGAKENDGDSIAVVLLPALTSGQEAASVAHVQPPVQGDGQARHGVASSGGPSGPAGKAASLHASGRDVVKGLLWLVGVLLLCLLGWVALRRASATPATSATAPLSDAEVDDTVRRVQAWLDQEPAHAPH